MFADKVLDDISITINSRSQLHLKVYQHKRVIGFEEQLVDILTMATPYLLFPGTDGKLLTMPQAVHDMNAYFLMRDNVLDLVRLFTFRILLQYVIEKSVVVAER